MINIRWVVFGVVVFCFLGLPAYSAPWSGSGTGEDPYQIWDACDMQAIGADANYWGAHFKLMADIDLKLFSGTSFNIIGDDVNNPFTGVFEGDGFKISNFRYEVAGSYRAIFNYVAGPAEIKNLGLIDVDMRGWGYLAPLAVRLIDGALVSNCYVEGGTVYGDAVTVGGLVAHNVSGTIEDCHASLLVGNTISVVGGLVGDNDGNISNCYATGDVQGPLGTLGGLIGDNSGTIEYCYATGDISTVGSAGMSIGGLVGINGGTISNCHAHGSVGGGTLMMLGGLVGNNGSGGSIDKSYSTGHVDVGGMGGHGGLVGSNSGTVTNSFWDKDTSGLNVSAGGTGKTTTQMQTLSTFTSAGWDFVRESSNGTDNIWIICGGVAYPKLIWESVIGNFDCDGQEDFVDFAILGLAWEAESGYPGWNSDCDISEPNDDIIDERDLTVFTEAWLGEAIPEPPVFVRLFYDGFESGDFATGGWTKQNNDAVVNTGAAKRGTYGAELKRTTWIEKTQSTGGYSGIRIKYRRKTNNFDVGERFYAEWYDGSGWNILEAVQTSDWGLVPRDWGCGEGASDNADFKLRFRTNAGAGNESAFLDDVEIVGIAQ